MVWIWYFQDQKIYIELLSKLLDIDNNLSVRNDTKKTFRTESNLDGVLHTRGPKLRPVYYAQFVARHG